MFTVKSIIILKNETVWFYNVVMNQEGTDGMANSVDPDQTAPKEQSGQDLQSLLSPSCCNTLYWHIFELPNFHDLG